LSSTLKRRVLALARSDWSSARARMVRFLFILNYKHANIIASVLLFDRIGKILIERTILGGICNNHKK